MAKKIHYTEAVVTIIELVNELINYNSYPKYYY